MGSTSHIYKRPGGYGGTPDGVDLILHYYHELWAAIFCREKDYEEITREIRDEEACDSANFATRYQWDHPGATEIETIKYVVQQWKRISDRLNIPIPWKEIETELSGLNEFREMKKEL